MIPVRRAAAVDVPAPAEVRGTYFLSFPEVPEK